MREEIILRARQKSIVNYLIAAGVKGTYKNGRWICCSPLRDENKPSFAVHVEKNVWYDYGLWEGGDLIKLVEKLNGFPFQKAVRYIEGLDLSGAADDDGQTSIQQCHKEVKTEVPPDTGQSKTGKKTVEKYFKALGLPYYPEIEAFPLSYKGKNYIGIPVSNPAERLGIECRGFSITSQGITPNTSSRFCLGRKLPWVLMRDPERFLVTESINDSLAGEVILGDNQISLIGLTGVGLRKMLLDYIPEGSHVSLAFDYDGKQNDEIGQRMEAEAEALLLTRNCHVSHVTNHIKAGVKDLYRLLLSEIKNN